MGSPQNNQILIVAGEPSGDERAAELVSAIKAKIPDLHFFGMGGDSLRNAGVEIIVDIKETAIIGILEALKSVKKFLKIKKKLIRCWQERRPVAALLVDFGGFNLRLAKDIKNLGGTVAYYISPQIWASRPGRIKFVKNYVDMMMVLFDFEKTFYRNSGINAVHVGHPLIDKMGIKADKKRLLHKLGFSPSEKVIGIMPGSRKSEIERMLPVLNDVTDRLVHQGYSQFMVIAAPNVVRQVTEGISNPNTKIVTDDKYSHMAACDFMLITSGTAALEVGYLKIPSIVVYKTSWLTAFLAKYLIKVEHISLPNILLKREVFPELLQEACNPDSIVNESLAIIEDAERYDTIRDHLSALPQHLGESGAVARAADCFIDFLGLQ